MPEWSYEYTTNNPKVMAIPGCVYLIPNVVLCYFFYTYANNNPDVDNNGFSCYARNGDNVGYPNGDMAGSKDITSEFETWFKFGFILNILHICVGLFMLMGTAAPFCSICGICLDCPVTLGGAAWFITGMVFRWRHIGKVCSGDYYDAEASPLLPDVYMHKSGKFMQVFFILTFSLCGAICLFGCCGGCIMAVCFGEQTASRRNHTAAAN